LTVVPINIISFDMENLTGKFDIRKIDMGNLTSGKLTWEIFILDNLQYFILVFDNFCFRQFTIFYFGFDNFEIKIYFYFVLIIYIQ